MAFSAGWFSGFLKRKHLSLHISTKRAQVVPADYKDKIISQLQFNRHAQARFDFKLSEIANIDQTPIAFKFLNSRTYNTKGIKTIFIKQTSLGQDQQQTTLQILVYTNSIQRYKPLLIFYSKNKDYRQKPVSGPLRREYRLYDSRVEVSIILKYLYLNTIVISLLISSR